MSAKIQRAETHDATARYATFLDQGYSDHEAREEIWGHEQ